MSCSCSSKKSQINAMDYSSDDNDEYYLRTVDHPKVGPNNAYYVDAYYNAFPKTKHEKKQETKKRVKKCIKKHKNNIISKVFQEPQKEETNHHDDPPTTAAVDHGDNGDNRIQENVAVINVAEGLNHSIRNPAGVQNPIQENIPVINAEGINHNPGIILNTASAAVKHHTDKARPVGDGGVLVFLKQLQKTDTSDHHSRLLIPKKQILCEFLTADEEYALSHQTNAVVPAKLVLNDSEYDIKLRMQKVGTSSCCYTIGKPWNDIRKQNGLVEGMKVELRALRGEGQRLWIRLSRS